MVVRWPQTHGATAEDMELQPLYPSMDNMAEEHAHLDNQPVMGLRKPQQNQGLYDPPHDSEHHRQRDLSPDESQHSRPNVTSISSAASRTNGRGSTTSLGDAYDGQPNTARGKRNDLYLAEEYTRSPMVRSSRKKSWLGRWWSSAGWTKEIVSIIFSWVLQGGIVIILACMSGKPQSSWHFFATINAVISILSTTGKGTLAIALGGCISQWKWFHYEDGPKPLKDFESFDAASRGTMGSLKFLYKIRWNIATMGAIATIMAFGIDPSYQQVVSFETRNVQVADNETATYAFAREYVTGAIMSPFNHGFIPDSRWLTGNPTHVSETKKVF